VTECVFNPDSPISNHRIMLWKVLIVDNANVEKEGILVRNSATV
jgi:hypothetical protein